MTTRAAVYLRCSTLKQEDSPERQRSQILPFAERFGFEIVETFADEGIPGDEIEGRPEFCRMLDLAKRGKFSVILCDDVDRFGRFDSLQLGEVASPLVRAGVRLFTVAQGEVQWTNLAGRINSMLQAEFKKAESKDISRRVTTDLLRRAKLGEWVSGRAPYGYTAQKVRDEGGAEKRTLVPDADESLVVKWLFEQVALNGQSLNWCARELTARRTALPKGRCRQDPARNDFWYPKQLANILRNRAYVGDTVWNRTSGGGYSSCVDGVRVIQHDSKSRKTTENPAEAVIEIRGTHEALVSRDVFEKAQAVLVGNKKRTTPKQEADYLFTRLLVCARCGSFMVGRPYQRPKGQRAKTSEPDWKDQSRRFYMCGGYFRLGKDYCKAHTFPENVIRERVLDAVEGYCRRWIDECRAALAAEIEAFQNSDQSVVKKVRRDVAELQAKIDTGEQNLIFEPRDTPARRERAERLRAKLDEMEAERVRLVAELDRIESGAIVREKEESMREHEELLWAVREALTSEEPAAIRRVLREIIDRVELTFNYRVAGKRELSSLKQAVIYTRPQRVTTKLCESATSWASTAKVLVVNRTCATSTSGRT